MLTLTFIDDWPAELRDSLERVQAALSHRLKDLPEGNINLKLVDDTDSQELNDKYSGNAYATDVLTFSYGNEDGEIADIVINLDEAERQAKEAGIGLEDEVALLGLHGLLHALGYDHQTTPEKEQLDHLQENLLSAAGFKYREFEWQDS